MSQNALSQGLSIDLNPTPYYLSKPEDKATPPIDIPPLKTSADVYTASQRLAQPRAEAESGVLKAQLGMEENVATQKAKAAEGVATEAHKTADAYQKRLSEFPYPEFHPTKDNVQSLAGLFSIVSTLGLMLGHSGKMSGMTALKSMKGMMDGWQKGRADLFKYEAENFQKNFARMKAVHDDLKSDFDEYMKLLPIDREAAMYKAEEIARKAGTNSIITANLQRGKLNVVQENIDAAGKLIAEKEKKAEEVRVRERERLLSEAFQEKLQQYPIVFPPYVFERPVFLFREFTVPPEIDHRRTVVFCQFNRAVGGAGVHHDHFAGPANGIETGTDVDSLLANRNKNRKHKNQKTEVDRLIKRHYWQAADFNSRLFTIRAGLPATIVQGSTSFTTTARAPTTAPSPTVTPGPTNASAQIQAWSLISIGGLSNGRSGCAWS